MHILYITNTLLPFSGWGTYSQTTVQAMKERGHTVTVLTNEVNKDVDVEQLAVLPDPIEMVVNPLKVWKAASAIKKALKDVKPDCMHILAEPYALAIGLIPRRLLAPCTMNLHGTYCALPFTVWWSSILMHRAVERMQGFLPCSHFTQQQALSVMKPKTKKYVEDHCTFFRFGLAPLENVERSETEKKHIIYLGGVKVRKGIRELLRGFAEFAKKHPNVAHVDVIGHYDPEHPLFGEMQTLLKEHGVTNQVTFHGVVEEDVRNQLLGQASVLALLSRTKNYNFEGYGLSIIEANSLGIPALAAFDNGCAEAVKDGETGYTVNPDDPADITKRLEDILLENTIQSEACKAWFDAHNIDQMVATFEDHYTALRQEQ